jgi:cell wall-associated NlpC family hydrolase
MADAPHRADLREIIDPLAPMRREPSHDAPLETQALKGERVTVEETTPEGWCRGTLDADGSAGWLPTNALAAPGPAATHKVAVPRTLAFPGPSIKLPPIEGLWLGCWLAVARIEEPFAVLHSGGYVPARHLALLDAVATDMVAVAEQFLHVPYLWGGKTALGLDCSGLIQIALTACGLPCPRNSAMQEQALGVALSPAADHSNLRRGDLLFWKGHVAIARGARTLIHANAFHMAVATETIAQALARIAAGGSELTSVRRIGTT